MAKKPQASLTPHHSDLIDFETGEITPAPYLAIDRPMLESSAWATLSSKAHEIYLPLRLKWWKSTLSGAHESAFIFTVADCNSCGVKVDKRRLRVVMNEFEANGFIEIERKGAKSGRRNRIKLCDAWRKIGVVQKCTKGGGTKVYLLSRGKSVPPQESPCKNACEGIVLRELEDKRYMERCIGDAKRIDAMFGSQSSPETIEAIADVIRVHKRERVKNAVRELSERKWIGFDAFWSALISKLERPTVVREERAAYEA